VPRKPSMALAAGSAVLAAALVSSPASAAHEQLAVTGLTHNDLLVSFRAGDAATVTDSVKLRELGGADVLGIDYRPATGELYAVLRDADGTGRVARVDPATGRVTSGPRLTSAAGSTLMLLGANFDLDFNPVVDRLRVVSDAGQNLRIDVGTGVTTVDGTLTYAGGSGAPRVSAAAYTNNDRDAATGTTLFVLDGETDTLNTQAPPNDGILNQVGEVGLPSWPQAGLDVYSEGAANIALLALRYRGSTTLSVVDLSTGAVNAASTTKIGARSAVVDIAIPTVQ
jgi:hypothetical protein